MSAGTHTTRAPAYPAPAELPSFPAKEMTAPS
jgi:hypothetical protein